jgi:hypothetical protein
MAGEGLKGHPVVGATAKRPELLRFRAAGARTTPGSNNDSSDPRHSNILMSLSLDLARKETIRTQQLFAVQHLRPAKNWLNYVQI